MLHELFQKYLPKYEQGRQINYGFYTMLDGQPAGMSVLTVDGWQQCSNSTGADVFRHMRERGVTPRIKPHLFLVFKLLGLNRVATGCLASNLSSKRSIEKTTGFQVEGISRESGINGQGEFDDEYLYVILRRNWLIYYSIYRISVIS